MAYANWLSLSKDSGSGNDTVNVSSKSNNTGRNVRTTNVTFKAVGCTDVVRVVNQAGKPEFGTFNNSTAAAAKTGQTLTLSGTSNSKKLTFSKTNDGIGLTIPSSYTAAGVSTANGSNISGDPGAAAEYAWSIAMAVPANTGTAAKTCQIVVTDDGGNTSTCTITLAAGDATLSVSPASVDIPWDGSASAQFTVESNTNWTVE